MISEKSHEIKVEETESELEDENKTLKYDCTEERNERRSFEESNKSKQSPKDLMYGQLEKIMSNCFKSEPKDTYIDDQEYKTLKYADTDENDENSHHDNSFPSNLSSPMTVQKAIKTPKDIGSRGNKNLDIPKSNKTEKDDLINPRDIQN